MNSISLTALSESFNAEYNDALVHQVVTAQRANERGNGTGKATRKTLTRAEVSGGGKKPWRQKGTGRARFGSSRNPIWTGGGHAFALTPKESYHQKINKKMYRGAMRCIFSELIRQGRLLLVDNFTVDSAKTREVVKKLAELDLKEGMIVTNSIDTNLFLAARNIPRVCVREVGTIDPISLIKYSKIIITEAAMKQIQEVLA